MNVFKAAHTGYAASKVKVIGNTVKVLRHLNKRLNSLLKGYCIPNALSAKVIITYKRLLIYFLKRLRLVLAVYTDGS